VATTCAWGGGSQSFSTFSNRLPPNSPTGINTQNRAAVPKISEAMERKGENESYLTAPPARSAAKARMVAQGASLLNCPGITPLVAAENPSWRNRATSRFKGGGEDPS